MKRKDARDSKTKMKDGERGGRAGEGREEADEGAEEVEWEAKAKERVEDGTTSSMRGRTHVRKDNKTKLDELQVVIREENR